MPVNCKKKKKIISFFKQSNWIERLILFLHDLLGNNTGDCLQQETCEMSFDPISLIFDIPY